MAKRSAAKRSAAKRSAMKRSSSKLTKMQKSIKSTPLVTNYSAKTPAGYRKMNSGVGNFKYGSSLKYNKGQFKKSLSSNLRSFSFKGKFIPK
jgi:hypothetical protein